jgi:hypothetical protein
VIVVVLVLGLGSCVSTRRIDPSSPDEALQQLQRSSKNGGRIVLHDGRVIHARELRVAAEQVDFTETRSGARRSVPTAQIREVHVRTPLRGALRGGLIGLGLGLLAASYPTVCCAGSEEDLGESGEDTSVVLARTGIPTAIGAFFGTVLGKRRYVFEPGP